MRTERVIDETARAILDGTPADWTGVDSSADVGTRDVGQQLKVLAVVARVHRSQADESVGLGQWGSLRLLELVGTGAFGEVYRAWDTRLDREVALKLLRTSVIPADGSSPIVEEGRLLARVRHPNVATIYGAEQIGGRVGLWMEFIRGRTLEELLRSGHQFNLFEVVDIGLELCRAVTAVHAAGVLHRDIKAQNVMRADDGRVVLTDFGAGLEQTTGASGTTGTPLYLAPEIFAGAQASRQTDVYSIGVLLYHLLTGRFPVEAPTIADLQIAHQQRRRAKIESIRADLPPALVRVIERATAAETGARYPTVDAIAADLSPLARRPRRVIAMRWAAAMFVLAGLAGGVWFGLTRGPGAANASTVAVAGNVIVVLPFKNLATDPQMDQIVDGFTYELIRNLSIIQGLTVRSATSSFAYKGKAPELAAIGNQLRANLVLAGSVFESAGQWRVQAELTRIGDDTPLWSDRFDRKVDGILTVQDEIALAVVNKLRLSLGKNQRRYDLDATSQNLYLRARALAARPDPKTAAEAVGLYEQIIARDPSFAPAYAGMCDAYGVWSQNLPDVGGMPYPEALVKMRTAALKAIELDPLLAESYAAMGLLQARELAWGDAERSYRKAIELNPTLSHVYATFSLTTLLPLGRFDEDELLLQSALQRDPFAINVQQQLGLVQLTSGRYEDAIRSFEIVNAADPAQPPTLLARAQTLAGRYQDAMPFWESHTQVGYQHWLAPAFVHAGRRAEVEQMVANEKSPYRQTFFYAALGDIDRALDALERAVDEAPQRTVRALLYPELAALRGHPRFGAVRARFKLP